MSLSAGSAPPSTVNEVQGGVEAMPRPAVQAHTHKCSTMAWRVKTPKTDRPLRPVQG